MTETLYDTVQLNQVRPLDTSFVTAYTAGTEETLITSIYVANTTNSKVDYSICLDVDGTTFNESTALFWEVEVDANNTILVEGNFPLTHINTNGISTPTQGSLAVKSSTANALTFTINGRRRRV